jgi:hypothetical protein
LELFSVTEIGLESKIMEDKSGTALRNQSDLAFRAVVPSYRLIFIWPVQKASKASRFIEVALASYTLEILAL